jgi:hypothetical protein
MIVDDPINVAAEAQVSAGIAGLRRVLRAVLSGEAIAAAPAPWPDVWRQACLHDLDAYLFPAVSVWPEGPRPPPPLLEDARQAFRVRAVAAVRTNRQLGALLGALRAAGVAAIPLKGSWLAEQVYDDIVCRPMNDIDVLVRPADAAAAGRALEAAGYVAADAGIPDGWSRERHFRHPRERVGVELQWHVWHANHSFLRPPDVERLWASASRAVIAGVAVPVLAPAAHAVYLIYHLLAHQWRFPARAHLDLVLLGRRHAAALPAGELAAEARAWGLGFSAPFVWRVAHDLCGVEPAAASAGWAPDDPAWMRAERRAALALALPQTPWRVPMSTRLCEFRLASWRRRLALGAAAIALSPDGIRHAHPVATRYAGLAGGYAVRAWDLAVRRTRDLIPVGWRRAAVATAADDMAARQRHDRWLQEREKNVESRLGHHDHGHAQAPPAFPTV